MESRHGTTVSVLARPLLCPGTQEDTMRTPTITLALVISTLTLTTAAALPPSTHLSGADGELTWTVSRTGDGITIRGASPKWTVVHTADATLEPIRTVHTDADGRTVTIDYAADGARVQLPGKTITHDEGDLWDADTVDIRLGEYTSQGSPEVGFRAIDSASGKVYSFESVRIAEESCGEQTCTHVRLQLTGLLRAVGPKWHYWFAGNGQLLRFEGPAGTFAANGGER
jgi:hypothetical protein